MSSTTTGGTFAAPTGNSLYGRMPRQAGDGEAKPYQAEKYVPLTQVTVLPKPIETPIPRSEYPPAALRDGIEGLVVMRLTIDTEGRVAEAVVLEDPGHGFGEAAVRVAKRYFRFEPARRGDEAVSTPITYRVRFEID
jgi:protein TonB